MSNVIAVRESGAPMYRAPMQRFSAVALIASFTLAGARAHADGAPPKAPARPVTDFDTRQQKADENGELLYNLQVVWLDTEGAQIITVKVAGDPRVGRVKERFAPLCPRRHDRNLLRGAREGVGGRGRPLRGGAGVAHPAPGVLRGERGVRAWGVGRGARAEGRGARGASAILHGRSVVKHFSGRPVYAGE